MAAGAGSDALQAGAIDRFGQVPGQFRGDDVAAQVQLREGQQLNIQSGGALRHPSEAIEVLSHCGRGGGGATALPESEPQTLPGGRS
jgi:hypothetical protein